MHKITFTRDNLEGEILSYRTYICLAYNEYIKIIIFYYSKVISTSLIIAIEE